MICRSLSTDQGGGGGTGMVAFRSQFIKIKIQPNVVDSLWPFVGRLEARSARQHL